MTKAVVFDMYETLVTLFDSPLYFSTQIAADLSMNPDVFRETWDPSEGKRSTGEITFEEMIECIMKKNNCFSQNLLDKITRRRLDSRRDCFTKLHPEIIPMLEAIHDRKIKIGLISNCFSEEAIVIRESCLFPYFDVVCLSYEERVMKPNPVIFQRCIEKLNVAPEECIYIGDGGSRELETAQLLGMHAIQACWYLREGTLQPTGRKAEFEQLNTPMEVPVQCLRNTLYRSE